MKPSNNQKLPLKALIAMMESDHKRVAEAIYKDYKAIIDVIPGATTKHQTWKGGYISHIEESMNLAVLLYKMLGSQRPLPFSLSAALFCVYLHDFDKVQRYKPTKDGIERIDSYSSEFIDKTKEIIFEKYNYSLSHEEYNALKYAHGEGSDYHPTDRIMLPLATLVHCCDVISARIWYDYGKSHDSWQE